MVSAAAGLPLGVLIERISLFFCSDPFVRRLNVFDDNRYDRFMQTNGVLELRERYRLTPMLDIPPVLLVNGRRIAWLLHTYNLYAKGESNFIDMLRRRTTPIYLSINLLFSIGLGIVFSFIAFRSFPSFSSLYYITVFFILTAIIILVLVGEAIIRCREYGFIIEFWEARNGVWNVK